LLMRIWPLLLHTHAAADIAHGSPTRCLFPASRARTHASSVPTTPDLSLVQPPPLSPAAPGAICEGATRSAHQPVPSRERRHDREYTCPFRHPRPPPPCQIPQLCSLAMRLRSATCGRDASPDRRELRVPPPHADQPASRGLAARTQVRLEAVGRVFADADALAVIPLIAVVAPDHEGAVLDASS